MLNKLNKYCNAKILYTLQIGLNNEVQPNVTHREGDNTTSHTADNLVVDIPSASIHDVRIVTDNTTAINAASNPVLQTLPGKRSHLEGSRLFNLQNLHNPIKSISEHSIKCGAVVELVGEVQRNGLASRLLATCSKCNEEILFNSCNKVTLHNNKGKERSTWVYNAAAVMGQMATGGGHSSLEELLSTLGVPSLTKQIFIDIEQCLGTSFEQLLLELMIKTGKEENC